MPSTPTASRRFSLTTIAGLTAIAAWCIRTGIHRSAEPGSYYGYFRHPESFVFPVGDVIKWMSVIATETVIASWLVWRARSARAVSLAIALVLGLGAVVSAPFAMHAPPYLGVHIVFLVFAALWLALAAIVGWIAQSVSNARERARRQREGDLPPPAIVVTKKSPAAR
jgi:hypothetical protein